MQTIICNINQFMKIHMQPKYLQLNMPASNKDAKMGLALRPNYLKLIYQDNIAFGIQSSKNFGSKTIPL